LATTLDFVPVFILFAHLIDGDDAMSRQGVLQRAQPLALIIVVNARYERDHGAHGVRPLPDLCG